MNKILFVSSSGKFFVSHRKEIIKDCIDKGFEVHIASNDVDFLRESFPKANVHFFDFKRGSLNIFSFIQSIINMKSLLLKLKPDLCHAITLQPIIILGILLRLNTKIKLVLSFAGLGLMFSSTMMKFKILRNLFIKPLLAMILSKKDLHVIFQNPNDRHSVLNINSTLAGKTTLLPGSGVDLDVYRYFPQTYDKFIVCFISRLLVDKGIKDFIYAAKKLKKLEPEIKFWVIGEIDESNPNSISKEEIEGFNQEENISFLGKQSDIPNILRQSNILVFPSYYGEGIPKTILEAAACGRPVITTDHPGCRDGIINNSTGLLVKIKSPDDIATKVLEMYKDQQRIEQFSENSRKLAKDKFNVKNIVNEHANIYMQMLQN